MAGATGAAARETAAMLRRRSGAPFRSRLRQILPVRPICPVTAAAPPAGARPARRSCRPPIPCPATCSVERGRTGDEDGTFRHTGCSKLARSMGGIMIRALFGSGTTPYMLRKSLDESMRAHREIAARIAGETESSSVASSTKDGKAAGANASNDLSSDMSALADTQIRYETEARLLQLVYQGLRRSITNNG